MFVKPAGNAYPVGGEGGLQPGFCQRETGPLSRKHESNTHFFKEWFVYLQQEEVVKEKAGRARPCLL